MNVLILTDVGVAGTQEYCELLAKLNSSLGNDVVRVQIGKRDGTCVNVIPVQGHAAPIIRAFRDHRLAKELHRICHDFNVDLIHANILNVRHLLAIRDLRPPIVLTTHTWIYGCPIVFKTMLPELTPCNRSFPNGHCVICTMSKCKLSSEPIKATAQRLPQLLYHAYALRATFQRVNSIISPSRDFARELDGKTRTRVYHIPNPMNPAMLGKVSKVGETGNVSFLGRLEWQKGAKILPEVAELLEGKTVHVAGKGSLKEWLLRQGVDNLFFHGFLAGERKISFLKRSSVVIIPSIVREMFPYVTLEAFASCKPVVAFDVGGAKEQIETSGGGLLARPFDLKDFAEKVNYLVDNPSEANEMGIRGRNWVEHNLHPDSHGRALAKVYDRTVEDS